MSDGLGDSPGAFDVIRAYDPAIDTTVVDGQVMSGYAITRDQSLLTYRDGMRPMVFRCRPLKRRERNQIRGLSALAHKRELAFRYSVISIKDYPRDDGTTKDVVAHREGDSALSDAALDELGIGDNDIDEVGEEIFRRATLGKGQVLWCVPPDTSQHAVRSLILTQGSSAEPKPAS